MKFPTTSTLSWYQIPQVIVFTLVLLYIGKPFFIPLGFSVLLSFILFPICKWFEERKVPRTWAISLSFLIVSSVLSLLLVVILYQLNTVGDKIPVLFGKISQLFAQIQAFIAQNTPISLEQQMLWLQQSTQEVAKYIGSSLKGTIGVTIDLFIFVVLVPFLSILFLFNREKFLAFIKHLLPATQHDNILPILHSSITTFYGYIKGLLVVYIIVAILNSIGLLLLGLENAVFYGVLTAILTVIPYFGILIGALLPITEAWLVHDSLWYPLGVVLVFTVVQYIEANIIFPIAVGHQLRINTFATLMALLLGGLIWGASGMVLFLPFTAILKLVADKSPDLQFIADLLDDSTTAKN